MPSDAYPDHLLWAKPGEKLLFRRKLEAEGRWPPPLDARPTRDDREQPPATPFLVIPEDKDDRGTIARRRWATNPSVFLLSQAGTLQTTPRAGETYRIAALVRNAGEAPSLMTFAEFRVASFRPDAAERAVASDLLNPGEFADSADLGVTAFSVAKATTTWVASRATWTCPSDADDVFFAAVRVFDPLHDAAAGGWRSRVDRKVALRLLAPDASGTWTGVERRTRLDETTEDIGNLRVRVALLAPPVERADGAADVSLSVVLEDHGRVSGHFEEAQVVTLTSSGFTIAGYRRPPGTDVLTPTEMRFVRSGDNLVSRAWADGSCEAVLAHAGPLEPAIVKADLPATEPSVSATWPASRRADAMLLREAVQALP